jgi:hypothetical protein
MHPWSYTTYQTLMLCRTACSITCRRLPSWLPAPVVCSNEPVAIDCFHWWLAYYFQVLGTTEDILRIAEKLVWTRERVFCKLFNTGQVNGFTTLFTCLEQISPLTCFSAPISVLFTWWWCPPITVAARSKVWTVFARSNAGIVGSNPTRGLDVCVCVLIVCR